MELTGFERIAGMVSGIEDGGWLHDASCTSAETSRSHAEGISVRLMHGNPCVIFEDGPPGDGPCGIRR